MGHIKHDLISKIGHKIKYSGMYSNPNYLAKYWFKKFRIFFTGMKQESTIYIYYELMDEQRDDF